MWFLTRRFLNGRHGGILRRALVMNIDLRRGLFRASDHPLGQQVFAVHSITTASCLSCLAPALHPREALRERHIPGEGPRASLFVWEKSQLPRGEAVLPPVMTSRHSEKESRSAKPTGRRPQLVKKKPSMDEPRCAFSLYILEPPCRVLCTTCTRACVAQRCNSLLRCQVRSNR